MAKNKPNRPLNQSFQRGCARLRTQLLTISLHCHRWSVKSRWQTVALAQTAKVPLSRASACRVIPRQVPGRTTPDAWRARVASARFGAQDTCDPRSLVVAPLYKALGPLCQTSLWGAAAGLTLPG